MVLTDTQFQKRIESIFKDWDIFYYRECARDSEDGPEFTPFIELNARYEKKNYEFASAYINLKQMQALSKLTGTEDVRATAYDLSPIDDGSDHCLYVLIEHPKFKKVKKKVRR